MSNHKRAVILAGGKGTRLKPYTISLPKPLVPIVDTPVIEIIIRQLKNNNFHHITLAVNHMSEVIKAYCGDGSKWGIKIDYSQEETPLGTMGPLKNIKDLPNTFLVLNGDIITDLNYEEFYNSHNTTNSIFTISSYSRMEEVDYGVLETSENMLLGFKEKPKINYEVSMGIYMVSKEVLKFIPENQAYGFDQLMLKLLKSKKKVAVQQHKDYWLDIGRPSDYMIAIDDYESKIKKYIF
jgi:NDP-mannose synthase